MIIIILFWGMWRSWYLYIYIYMHSDSWEMGIWTPPVLGQHGCPTFDGPPHHPPTVWPRESWWRVRFFCRSSAFSKKPVTFDHLINLKLTWEPNHQDSNMGTTFFYRTTFFFTQRIPRLCVVFWALFIDPSDLARKKTQNLPQTTTDLMLKRIWSLAKIHLW